MNCKTIPMPERCIGVCHDKFPVKNEILQILFIELDNIFDDRALNAYGISWIERSGGWTRTKTTNYLVYIDHIVEYLKTQGYVAYSTRWIKTLTLTVKWKGEEE